jgi:ATP-dependent Clp endopeptidase proteolytic subunit ClpP
MAVDKLFIDGYIGQDFTTKHLREFLKSSQGETIEVHINSGGGSVTEGFAIYDILKATSMLTGQKIKTIVEGMCGSIATIISQAGANSGGRFMHSNSEYFIHNPYWEPYAPVPYSAEELQQLADDLGKAKTRILDFYAAHTGQTAETLAPLLDRQTTLTAEEAINLGFIDGIENGVIAHTNKYELKAFINKQNQSQMSDTKLDGILAKVNALFSRVFKNAMTETSEGVVVYYDGEIGVGTKVFLDPEMTKPAPDGKHTVGDKIYVVADGAVTEVLEVEDNAKALAAANARIAELETQLSASAKETNEVKAEVKTLSAAVQAYVKNYKPIETPRAGQVERDETITEPTFEEKLLALRKQKTTK